MRSNDILSPARHHRGQDDPRKTQLLRAEDLKTPGPVHSTQRRTPFPSPSEEERLWVRLRVLAKEHQHKAIAELTPPFAKRANSASRQTHFSASEEELGVLRKAERGIGWDLALPESRAASESAHQVWAIDFIFGTDSRPAHLKILVITNGLTKRKGPLGQRTRPPQIDGGHTARVVDQIISSPGRRPELVRMENKPELLVIARRKCYRFTRSSTSHIEPGSPRTPLFRIVQR